jgi:hypothetical protein
VGKRRKPWWGAGPYEDFRQKVVQRFGNFDTSAKDHVIGRNAAVAQTLGYLNLLYNAGAIPAGGRFVANPGGACWQTTGGSRGDRTEGAHCLPCQIMVVASGGAAGTDPSDLAPNQEVREGIRSEFAHVTVLPAVFNSADVVAEQCFGGLRQAFVNACQAVIRGPRRDREHRYFRERNNPMTGEFRDVWLLSRDSVRAAYHTVWIPQAEQAYEKAMDEVQAGRLDRYLAPLARKERPDLVMEVLNAYLKYHHVGQPSKLLDSQMDGLESQFNG